MGWLECLDIILNLAQKKIWSLVAIFHILEIGHTVWVIPESIGFFFAHWFIFFLIVLFHPWFHLFLNISRFCFFSTHYFCSFSGQRLSWICFRLMIHLIYSQLQSIFNIFDKPDFELDKMYLEFHPNINISACIDYKNIVNSDPTLILNVKVLRHTINGQTRTMCVHMSDGI